MKKYCGYCGKYKDEESFIEIESVNDKCCEDCIEDVQSSIAMDKNMLGIKESGLRDISEDWNRSIK